MRRTRKTKETTAPVTILFAAGTGLLTMLIMTAGGAWLLEQELIRCENDRYLAAIALVTGAWVGCGVGGRGEGRAKRNLLIGGIQILCLLLINLLRYGGVLSGVLPGSLLIMGISLAAAILRSDKKLGKTRGIPRRKYSHL